MSDIPATIELNPPGMVPKATVIWLHGLGADGNDFVPIVERLHPSLQANVRFIFPHAPRRAITVNGGMVMRGWYDIVDTDLLIKEDTLGLQQSEQQIRRLIEREEQRGVSSDHIVLVGFSQGGGSFFTYGFAIWCWSCGHYCLIGVFAAFSCFPSRTSQCKSDNAYFYGTWFV